jgi:hypothetical protein
MHTKPWSLHFTAFRIPTSTSSIRQRITDISRISCQSSRNPSILVISEKAGNSMGSMYHQIGSAAALATCCSNGASKKLPMRVFRLFARVPPSLFTSTSILSFILWKSKCLISTLIRVTKAIIVWSGTRESRRNRPIRHFCRASAGQIVRL